MRLDYGFVDRNEHFKKDISATTESVAEVFEKDLNNKRFPWITMILTRYSFKELIFFNWLHKQTDDCTMGYPLSVTICNVYLSKLEKDKKTPLKPKFYRRFLDDMISRRLKNKHDSLFEKINNYYEKSQVHNWNQSMKVLRYSTFMGK